MVTFKLPQWRHAHPEICLADDSVSARRDHFVIIVIAFEGSQALTFLMYGKLTSLLFAAPMVPKAYLAVLMRRNNAFFVLVEVD